MTRGNVIGGACGVGLFALALWSPAALFYSLCFIFIVGLCAFAGELIFTWRDK